MSFLAFIFPLSFLSLPPPPPLHPSLFPYYYLSVHLSIYLSIFISSSPPVPARSLRPLRLPFRWPLRTSASSFNQGIPAAHTGARARVCPPRRYVYVYATRPGILSLLEVISNICYIMIALRSDRFLPAPRSPELEEKTSGRNETWMVPRHKLKIHSRARSTFAATTYYHRARFSSSSSSSSAPVVSTRCA